METHLVVAPLRTDNGQSLVSFFMEHLIIHFQYLGETKNWIQYIKEEPKVRMDVKLKNLKGCAFYRDL
jgi:hypothetical protein